MKRVLITGGTGTFGRAFTYRLLGEPIVERIVVYSRDEQKQEEMERDLGGANAGQLRFMMGDVRDESRLCMAMRGIDTVVHAAALKIVPKCEYDPIEAVRTNVGGAENVIKAAISANVAKVIALSTDKAVSPINLYGATKLTAERLFIAANHLSGSPGDKNATRFSVVRYGNVSFSRGSVIPLFKRLRAAGEPLPITHPEMTRFWITIEDAVKFVIRCLQDMHGGEVFIPRMPSFRIVDLAEAFNHGWKFPAKIGEPTIWETKIIGMRPGEKIHETLITPHDVSQLWHDLDMFTILPSWRKLDPDLIVPQDGNFTYSSDTNTKWLSVDELRKLTTSAEEAHRRFIMTDGH